MHFVKQKKQQFRKENVIDVITNVSTLMQQSQREEIRALYGAGRYELATTHKRFAVDSARWNSWPEKCCASHVDAFQNFRPGLADTFEKPKTAGTKTSFRIKQKALAPEITKDHLVPSSKRQARDDYLNAPLQARESAHSGETLSSTQPSSQNSTRFADPREKSQKVFELYLRKNVPRSVRKCQGRCGNRITAEDPPIIIRSIGENRWTDKTTGREMSRVRPMYVHFNQNCFTLKFLCSRQKI